MQTPGVVLPDLPGTFLEAKCSENSDAGVHHVDLTKVLHFHSRPSRLGCPWERESEGGLEKEVVDLKSPALGIVCRAILASGTAHRPMAADTRLPRCRRSDLLVASEAHRFGQLSGTDHHRAQDQLALLNLLGRN